MTAFGSRRRRRQRRQAVSNLRLRLVRRPVARGVCAVWRSLARPREPQHERRCGDAASVSRRAACESEIATAENAKFINHKF